MSEPKVLKLSAERVKSLRCQFEKLEEITTFEADIKFAALVSCYGILREIGTVNDELARFIFDSKTEQPVRLGSLKAALVEWNNLIGLKIYSLDCQNLELRTKGFYEVIHRKLSQNDDGTLHSLYIFPEIINKIAESQGVELVLVKSWGLNSIFGGFDPAKGYYQTNFWEIENNDAIKFAKLVSEGKLALMGTHDLIAHVAGLDQNHWPLLKKNAKRCYKTIEAYFSSTSKPSISALILPYTVGVVLDDLAQPPSYSSNGHNAVLNELLLSIEHKKVSASLPMLLTRFPASFQKLIELSRTPNIEQQPEVIKAAVNLLVQEVLKFSVHAPQLS